MFSEINRYNIFLKWIDFFSRNTCSIPTFRFPRAFFFCPFSSEIIFLYIASISRSTAPCEVWYHKCFINNNNFYINSTRKIYFVEKARKGDFFIIIVISIANNVIMSTIITTSMITALEKKYWKLVKPSVMCKQN